MLAPNPGKRDVLISKLLSKLLRHAAVEENLAIDANGYVDLSELLNHHRIKSNKTTEEDIRRIVHSSDKQRFIIDESTGIARIRAAQGHTIQSVGETLLKEFDISTVPDEIFHGTYRKKLPQIISSGGLSRMDRNHIHFTNSDATSVSGIRKSANVLIYIDGKKCIEHGMRFFISSNGVILSSGNENGVIPVEFWVKVVDRNSGEIIENKKSN